MNTMLTEDEAALLYHVQMRGSTGYPVEKRGRGWVVRDWRSVRGAPVVLKTKRAAIERFEAWLLLAKMRWTEFKASNPTAIMTAVGIRVQSS